MMTEAAICPAMEILAINILCYGDEAAPRVTAIGCGGEESSSRANGFCYRCLAAGTLIKKWKRSRGKRFLLSGSLCQPEPRRRDVAVSETASGAPLNILRRKARRHLIPNGLLGFQRLFLA